MTDKETRAQLSGLSKNIADLRIAIARDLPAQSFYRFKPVDQIYKTLGELRIDLSAAGYDSGGFGSMFSSAISKILKAMAPYKERILDARANNNVWVGFDDSGFKTALIKELDQLVGVVEAMKMVSFAYTKASWFTRMLGAVGRGIYALADGVKDLATGIWGFAKFGINLIKDIPKILPIAAVGYVGFKLLSGRKGKEA